MRNNLASSVDHQKSHRHFMEKNMNKCSWRCIAIFFVVLAVILSAALAYITGKFVYIFSCLFTTFSCLFTTFSCLFIKVKIQLFVYNIQLFVYISLSYYILQPLVSFLCPTKVPKLVQWWSKIILNKNPPLPSLLPKKIVLHFSILPPPFPTKIM